MDAILQLDDLPKMETNRGEEAELSSLRTTPLPGEKTVFWAIQDGANVDSRRVLPQWLSQPIERAISRWVEESHSWNAKIDARMALGKPLAPSMQTAYEKWCTDRGSCNLLFSKAKKSVIHAIRSNADANKMRQDLFSILIQFSEDRERLLVRAANGASQRLVLLQGEAAAESGVPDILDQRPTAEQVEQVLGQQEEEDVEDTASAGSQNEHDEEALKIDEEHANLEEEMQFQNNLQEIMADSSEEEVVQATVSGQHSRVKSFHHREAYRKLQELGLADIPSVMPGVFLGCHATTRTWQGFFPDEHTGLSATWGGSTGRTEPEALLRVVTRLLECHCGLFPRDKMWRQQLQKVQDAAATVHRF